MKIYEKIFERLEELNMSQIELSGRTGIATSTISDWRKKQINPQADKLVPICKALEMSITDLLCDEDDKKNISSTIGVKRRILNFYEQMEVNKVETDLIDNTTERNISIIRDVDGNNIVLINDILFKSRRSIEWDEIEKLLRKSIGNYYEIAETAEKIYIGSDFPDEFAHSKYTKAIKGANEKAKANSEIGRAHV